MSHLHKKTIISTRPSGRSSELKNLFEQNGGKLLELPMIEIAATSISEQERAILGDLSQFEWIIFTSVNGVKYLFEHIEQLPKESKVISIGSRTTAELEQHNINVSYQNSGNTSIELLNQLKQVIPQDGNQNMLLITGNLATNRLKEGLHKAGTMKRVDVYKTIAPQRYDSAIVQQINQNNFDMIIFTSPSGVKHFIEKFSTTINCNTMPSCCIGNITATALKQRGINPTLVAPKATPEAIYNCIEKYFRKEQSSRAVKSSNHKI